MIVISKSKLRTQMLRIFRDIEETGEPVIVTDRGRPVLRIDRIAHKQSVREAFGAYRGRVDYAEPPESPTQDEWPEI